MRRVGGKGDGRSAAAAAFLLAAAGGAAVLQLSAHEARAAGPQRQRNYGAVELRRAALVPAGSVQNAVQTTLYGSAGVWPAGYGSGYGWGGYGYGRYGYAGYGYLGYGNPRYSAYRPWVYRSRYQYPYRYYPYLFNYPGYRPYSYGRYPAYSRYHLGYGDYAYGPFGYGGLGYDGYGYGDGYGAPGYGYGAPGYGFSPWIWNEPFLQFDYSGGYGDYAPLTHYEGCFYW